MDMLITILGVSGMLYLVVWATELVRNGSNPFRRSQSGPSLARMKHEKRMLARRLDKGYHV